MRTKASWGTTMAQSNDGASSPSVPDVEEAGTLVGRTVRKEFPFGVMEGKVAFWHRPDGEALLFRVVRDTVAVHLTYICMSFGSMLRYLPSRISIYFCCLFSSLVFCAKKKFFSSWFAPGVPSHPAKVLVVKELVGVLV